jgi:hypothetical protein
MKSEDAQRYCTMMAEIKGRTWLIKELGEGGVPWLPQPARVECVYLQLRKVIELIAIGSLLANAEAFSRVQSNIQKYWHAKNLLEDIEAINPDFYPRPIIQKPSQRPGIKMDWNARKDDFLTKDRFITLYDKCGSIMHARNPFAPEPDYQKLDDQAPKRYLWIVNLLNAHLIRLTGSANLYLVQMGSEEAAPTYAVFAPATPPQNV